MPWAGLLLALVALVLAVLPDRLQSVCALERGDVLALQPWRWWTGQFVHWGWVHAAVDATALLLTGLVAERQFGARPVLVLAWICAPLLSLGILWLEPSLSAYRGASGLVVLLGATAWVGLWRGREVGRGWLVVLAAGLAAKLAVEVGAASRGLPGVGLGLPTGVAVAWSAHGVGLALGALAGGLLPLRSTDVIGCNRP